MHLKTYLFVALVLVVAMGMGCGGSGTSSGGDTSSTLIGTWKLVSANGNFPQTIVFNSNGTGAYSGGINSNFTWNQVGNQVTISTGSAQPATIILSSSVVNTFTLNSLGGTGTYNRA
jgi:hypothetical protein